MANPNIAMRGIIRICASSNPAQGAEDSSRWQEVGYCGDSSMRCWLDSNSVKDDLEKLEALTNVTSDVLNKNRGLITEGDLNLEQVQVMLSSARQDIKGLGSNVISDGKVVSKVGEIVDSLNKITGDDDEGGAGTNNDRAEALALKASVYRMVVMKAFESEKAIENPKVKEARDNAEVDSESVDQSNCEYVCSLEDKEFIWYGMSSSACSDEDGELLGDPELGCCCEKISAIPITSTEITGEMLYNAIMAAEHRGNYNPETGQFVAGYDPFIRTRVSGSGSTAYGPAQLTMSLAESYLGRTDMMWTEEEKSYLNRFIDQGLKFIACGNRGDGIVDRTIFTKDDFEKYSKKYAQLDINYNTRCIDSLNSYDYGESGDLNGDSDRVMYKQVVIKMMLDIYNRVEKDKDKFWHAWRFGEGDITSQDPEYAVAFNAAIDIYRKKDSIEGSSSAKQIVESQFPFISGKIVFDLEKIDETSDAVKYSLYLESERLPFYFLEDKLKSAVSYSSIISEDSKYSFAMRHGVVNFKEKVDDDVNFGGYDFSSYNGVCYSLNINNGRGTISLGKNGFCDQVLKSILDGGDYSDYEKCKNSISGYKNFYNFYKHNDEFCVWKELRNTYKNVCSALSDEDITNIFNNKEDYREASNSGSLWKTIESDENYCTPIVYDCAAVFYENEHDGFFGYVHGANSPVYINPYVYNSQKYNAKDFYFTIMHEGYHSLQSGVFKILGGFSAFNIDSYYAYNREIDPRASIIQLWWLEKTCKDMSGYDVNDIIKEGIIYDRDKAEEVLDKFHDYTPYSFQNNFKNYYTYSDTLTGIFNAYNKLSPEDWTNLKNVLIERLPGIAYGGGSTTSVDEYISGDEMMYASSGGKNIDFVMQSDGRLGVAISLFAPIVGTISGAVVADGEASDSEGTLSPMFFDYLNPRTAVIPVKFDIGGVSFFKHPLMKAKFLGRSSIILGHVNIKSKENKLEYKISDTDSLLKDLGITEEELVKGFIEYHYNTNPCLRFYGMKSGDNCFVFSGPSDIGKIMNYGEATTCYFSGDREFKGDGQDFVNGVFDEEDIKKGDYVCSLTTDPLVENNEEWENKIESLSSYINYAKSTVFYINGKERRCDCGESCDNYVKWLYESSIRYNVPFEKALYLMILESSCNQLEVSSAPAYGLMQVTLDAFSSSCEGEMLGSSDLKNKHKSNYFSDIIGEKNAERNIDCGVKHFKKMYDTFKGGIKDSWAYKNNPTFKKIVDDCIKIEGEKYSNYVGWDAAMRGYNGWGCKGGSADSDYVDKMKELEIAFAGSGINVL